MCSSAISLSLETVSHFKATVSHQNTVRKRHPAVRSMMLVVTVLFPEPLEGLVIKATLFIPLCSVGSP